jgi:hypothetical protein
MSTIITTKNRQQAALAVFQKSPWRTLGWFGAVVTLIGLGQLLLYVFPAMAFGSPEWEYGASAQLIGALPLPTVGLAALFAAGAGSGSKRGMLLLSLVLVVTALAIFAVLVLFLTVVPMAIKATPANMREPIYQTIGRTLLSGIGFGFLYLWAAWLAATQMKRPTERLNNA